MVYLKVYYTFTFVVHLHCILYKPSVWSVRLAVAPPSYYCRYQQQYVPPMKACIPAAASHQLLGSEKTLALPAEGLDSYRDGSCATKYLSVKCILLPLSNHALLSWELLKTKLPYAGRKFYLYATSKAFIIHTTCIYSVGATIVLPTRSPPYKWNSPAQPAVIIYMTKCYQNWFYKTILVQDDTYFTRRYLYKTILTLQVTKAGGGDLGMRLELLAK